MSKQKLQTAVAEARNYIHANSKKINPDILQVMSTAIDYVEKELCPTGSSLIKNANRYTTINQIFNLGVDSSKSLEKEKDFFSRVQKLLEFIPEEKSKLRTQCFPLAFHGESKLMRDLEQHDPEHKNAVNAIVSGSLSAGFLFSFITRDPTYFILSLLPALLKYVPLSERRPSPSVLGGLVYFVDPNARQTAAKINSMLPANLSYRLLNLFSKASITALNTAEQVVSRAERLSGVQNSARIEYLDRQPIEDEQQLDTSYAARSKR